MKLIIFLVVATSLMAQAPAAKPNTAAKKTTTTVAKPAKPKKPMPKAKTIPPPPGKR